MKPPHLLILFLLLFVSACESNKNSLAFVYIKEDLQSSLGHPQDKEIPGSPNAETEMERAINNGEVRFNCVLRANEIPSPNSGTETTSNTHDVYSTYFVLGMKAFLVKGDRIYSHSKTRQLDFDMEKLLAEKCSSQT